MDLAGKGCIPAASALNAFRGGESIMLQRISFSALLAIVFVLAPGVASAGSPVTSSFNGIVVQNACSAENLVLNGSASAQLNLAGVTPMLNIQVPGTATSGSGAIYNFLVNIGLAVPSDLTSAFSFTSPLSGTDPALNTVVDMTVHIDMKAQNILRIIVDSFRIRCRRSPLEDISFARGFGSQYNKYSWSMKSFGDYLYVGTTNTNIRLFDAILDGLLTSCPISIENPYSVFGCLRPYTDSTGAEIWRYSYTNKTWEKVYGHPTDNPLTWSSGFREMEVFNGQLYASNSTLGGVTQLLRTSDGVIWNAVPGGPGTPGSPEYAPGTSSFRPLTVFQGKLFVGTDNSNGGQLWSYDENNGWSLIYTFNATGVAETAVFNNKLYIGTSYEVSPAGFGVYTYTGSGTPTPVLPSVIPPAAPWEPAANLTKLHNFGVARMMVFNNKLYMGTANFMEGFTLLSVDRYGNWKSISSNAFSYSRSTYLWSFGVYKNTLFMGTFNSLTFEVPLVALDLFTGGSLGAGLPMPPAQDLYRNIKVSPDPRSQLWMTQDGLHWVQVALPLRWNFWDYGIRNFETANGKLYLGTASNLFAPELPEAWAPFFGAGTSVWQLGQIPPGSEIIGTYPR